MTRIITASKHVTALRGAKMLLVGPTGVGKTSLLRTVDPETTLFIDIEAGDLAVQDVAVDTLRPRTWPECRDLAVALAGANPAVSDSACYSAGHYAAVKDQFGDPERLSRYTTFFIDSITAAGRLCFAWSSQQAEAFSDRTGKRDLRGAYGLHAREMIAWLMHLQQARAVNVVFLGILETVTDDNRTEHRLQLEGGPHRSRAAGGRRSGDHVSLARLRRRRPNAQLRLHSAEPLAVPGKGSQRPPRAARGAASRQTHRQAHEARSGGLAF
jgi:hypothetical protein